VIPALNVTTLKLNLGMLSNRVRMVASSFRISKHNNNMNEHIEHAQILNKVE